MLPLNSMIYFLYSSSYNPYNPSLIQKVLFELELLSQGIIEQDHLSKNVKKFRSDKKINFSNKSVKKPIIYDLLFIIATFYCLQNVNKQCSEMKNKHQNSLFTTSTVFSVWSPFCMQKITFGGRLPYKKIKSQ